MLVFFKTFDYTFRKTDNQITDNPGSYWVVVTDNSIGCNHNFTVQIPFGKKSFLFIVKKKVTKV